MKIDGLQVTEWFITSDKILERIIPLSFSGNKEPISILFDVPDAILRQELGRSLDPRKLGIGLFGLKLVQEEVVNGDQ